MCFALRGFTLLEGAVAIPICAEKRGTRVPCLGTKGRQPLVFPLQRVAASGEGRAAIEWRFCKPRSVVTKSAFHDIRLPWLRS